VLVQTAGDLCDEAVCWNFRRDLRRWNGMNDESVVGNILLTHSLTSTEIYN